MPIIYDIYYSYMQHIYGHMSAIYGVYFPYIRHIYGDTWPHTWPYIGIVYMCIFCLYALYMSYNMSYMSHRSITYM